MISITTKQKAQHTALDLQPPMAFHHRVKSKVLPMVVFKALHEIVSACLSLCSVCVGFSSVLLLGCLLLARSHWIWLLSSRSCYSLFINWVFFFFFFPVSDIDWRFNSYMIVYMLEFNWVLTIRKLTLDHSGLASLSITCILSYFISSWHLLVIEITSFIYLLWSVFCI